MSPFCFNVSGSIGQVEGSEWGAFDKVAAHAVEELRLINTSIVRSRVTVETLVSKAARLVALCLLIVLGAGAGSAVAQTPSPEVIYGEFKRYRLALADPDLNAVPFFSRHIYEMWGGELLARRSPVQLMDDVVVIRARYRLAEKVHLVYSYTVTANSRGDPVLAMVFANKSSTRPAILRLTYVMDDGQWRINAIDTDSTHKNLKASTVLDTFD